jgi:hypothetical protein
MRHIRRIYDGNLCVESIVSLPSISDALMPRFVATASRAWILAVAAAAATAAAVGSDCTAKPGTGA